MNHKRLALRLIRIAGGYRLARRLSRNRLTVVTYHKVLPDGARSRYDAVPETVLFASAFERQIERLTRDYHVLSGAEARAFLARGEAIPSRSVLITFDDGYRNNFTCAFPILRRAGAAAVFFVTTDFVNGHVPFLWFDRLDAVLAVAGRDAVKSWTDSHVPAAAQHAGGLRRWIKTLSRTRRDAVLAELGRRAGSRSDAVLDPEISGPMTWSEAREMSASGMTFGSHTASHQILSAAATGEIVGELAGSRRDIEANLDRECWCFSYPNGEATDFRPEDQRALRDAGYDCAFTQIPGFVDVRSDRYALCRYPVPATADMDVFLSRVTGIHRLFSRPNTAAPADPIGPDA